MEAVLLLFGRVRGLRGRRQLQAGVALGGGCQSMPRDHSPGHREFGGSSQVLYGLSRGGLCHCQAASGPFGRLPERRLPGCCQAFDGRGPGLSRERMPREVRHLVRTQCEQGGPAVVLCVHGLYVRRGENGLERIPHEKRRCASLGCRYHSVDWLGLEIPRFADT